MSYEDQRPAVPTNIAVARVLMFIQGGAYVALPLLGYALFFMFRGRMQQRTGAQPQGGQLGRGLLFAAIFVALGVLLIFLAVKIGRLSSSALIAATGIEGVISMLALLRLVRNPNLVPMLLFAFPALTTIFLATGIRSFRRAATPSETTELTE